jgi:hypothetical protein
MFLYSCNAKILALRERDRIVASSCRANPADRKPVIAFKPDRNVFEIPDGWD